MANCPDRCKTTFRGVLPHHLPGLCICKGGSMNRGTFKANERPLKERYALRFVTTAKLRHNLWLIYSGGKGRHFNEAVEHAYEALETMKNDYK